MAAQISRPMLILLAVTLGLTVLSFGVRMMRESGGSEVVEAPASASPMTMQGAPDQGPTPVPPIGALPPGVPPPPGADGQPPPEVLRPMDGVRQSWPAASKDAMPSRANAQISLVPPAAANNEPPPPPSPPPLPNPSFRLAGRFVDGKTVYAFFEIGESLTPIKVGQDIVDGFVLKSLNGETASVVRKADGQKFDMMLETP